MNDELSNQLAPTLGRRPKKFTKNTMKTIIKGAIYSDFQDDELLLIPIFSGVFNTVDCVHYYKLSSDTWAKYSETVRERLQANDQLEYDDEIYYEAEISGIITESMFLESDISELFHENKEF
jgi:hypothetical protein